MPHSKPELLGGIVVTIKKIKNQKDQKDQKNQKNQLNGEEY
jgi:hypothetical protein